MKKMKRRKTPQARTAHTATKTEKVMSEEEEEEETEEEIIFRS
jgi:hypothetical protein